LNRPITTSYTCPNKFFCSEIPVSIFIWNIFIKYTVKVISSLPFVIKLFPVFYFFYYIRGNRFIKTFLIFLKIPLSPKPTLIGRKLNNLRIWRKCVYTNIKIGPKRTRLTKINLHNDISIIYFGLTH